MFLRRLDGHIAVANSLAMGLDGNTQDTPDPPGGRIVRDERTRKPTGLLVGAAIQLMAEAMPLFTDAERTDAIRTAMRHAASLGVTSMQRPCSRLGYGLCDRLRRDDGLTTRIYAMQKTVALKPVL